MSEQHTPRAMRAAGKIAYQIWPNEKGYKDKWIDHKIEEFAAIIDGEMAAPELLKTLIDLIPYIDECEKLRQIQPMQAKAIREVASTAIANASPS